MKIKDTEAYKMGYDAAINGPNTTNCNFMIFCSSQNKDYWEIGKRDGEKDKKKNEQKKK